MEGAARQIPRLRRRASCCGLKPGEDAGNRSSDEFFLARCYRTKAGTSGPPLSGPAGTPDVAHGLPVTSDRPRYSRYIRVDPVPLPPALLLMGCSIRTQAHDRTGATVDPPVKPLQSSTATVASLRSPPFACR